VLKWHVGNNLGCWVGHEFFSLFWTISGIKTLRIEDVGYNVA